MDVTMSQLREGLQLLADVGGSAYLTVTDGLPYLVVAAINTPPSYDQGRLHELGWSGSDTDWKINF